MSMHNYFRDQKGVAAVEFALIVPILFILFLGVIEVSNLLIADAKARTATSSISDLITQDSDGVITSDELKIITFASKQIMAPLTLAGQFTIYATDYKLTAVGTVINSSVRWRRAFTPPNTVPSTTFPSACNGNALPLTLRTATLNDVLYVNSVYSWTPRWFTWVGQVKITSSNYNMPRYAQELVLPTGEVSGC